MASTPSAAPAAPAPAIRVRFDNPPGDASVLVLPVERLRFCSVVVAIANLLRVASSTVEAAKGCAGSAGPRGYRQTLLHRWPRQAAIEPRSNIPECVKSHDLTRFVKAD